jgi:hypothetical protein
VRSYNKTSPAFWKAPDDRRAGIKHLIDGFELQERILD